MRCPSCGLVHARSERVCRRCEIDLQTGEPVPRTMEAKPEAVKTSAMERLRERAKSPARAIKQKAERGQKQAPPHHEKEKHEKAGAHAHEPGKEQKAPKAAQFISVGMTRPSKGWEKIAERLGQKRGIKSISCVQCTQPMSIARQAPFSKAWPAVMIAMGVALLAGGIFLPLLLITGAISVVLGILYIRAGNTYWKCNSCGFVIPRAKG